MSSTDKRIDDLADRVGRFEARVDRRFDEIDRRFDKVDQRFDEVDQRFDNVGQRFETMVTKEQFKKAEEVQKGRFDRLEARLDQWGKLVGGGAVTIAAAMILRVIGV